MSDEYLASLSYNEEAYQRAIKNPKNIIYVADNNEELVGYACSGIDSAADAISPNKLSMVYVRKEYQNQGIGKKLLLKLAEHLCQSGCSTFSANTFAAANSNFFYSSLSGKICKKNVENIGGRDIDTVTYLFNLPIRF